MRVFLGCLVASVALSFSTCCFIGAGATYLLFGSGSGTVPQPATPAAISRPATPKLSVELPGHLDYSGVQKQLFKWGREATGELVRLHDYGKSSTQNQLTSVNIGNVHSSFCPRVLVHACIHGNEPLATSTVMGYIGRLLANYGKDERVTRLLDTRDIYFVPVVSPDSYPSRREVDGVDPNRDFPGPHDPQHKSTPSIAALQDFFLKIKPKAAWSGHTHGRVFMTPYGDSNERCKDEAGFASLFGQMAQLASYRHIHACEMYGHPIKGSEVDWYYRNGAASCVCEYGTHQHVPSMEDTKAELDRTWPAFLLWLEKAPLLLSQPSERGILCESFFPVWVCLPR